METDPSIVEYFAEHERYRCGYCGSSDTNYSHGMWTHQMNCQDYQDLIDRGWRRSGKYCYKPTMNVTCCPMYTIKCHATEFKLNKSHKKTIKRVNRYLINGIKSGQVGERETGKMDEDDKGDHVNMNKMESSLADKAKPSDIDMPSNLKKSTQKSEASNVENIPDQSADAQIHVSCAVASTVDSSLQQSVGHKKLTPRPGAGPDPNKPACRKAKEMRKEKQQMKKKDGVKSKKDESCSKKDDLKSLEDLLSEPNHAQNCAHRLEIRLVRSTPPSSQFTSTFIESHKVYHGYQTSTHHDPPDKPNQKQFKRFLCDSPLTEEHKEDGPPQGYGSFHQHYILDGKIIAVGVIDILPNSVSSVYLYYDPEYRFLGLGVYSSLREIAFVRELNQHAPDIKFYYLGFYIHSCPKMHYKGQYVPSFLVCPESYNWVPIEKCKPLLDASRYSRLSESLLEDKNKVTDTTRVLVLHKGTVMSYGIYKTMKKGRNSDDAEVMEYAGFVGKSCAERMLLVRGK